MRLLSGVKSLLLSWDWVLAFGVTALLALVLPTLIPLELAKEILSVSISVLAVVFSVFFAGLAVLITAGDNAFVRFLEEDGSYTRIVWTFRVTLLLLFGALLASIVLFVVAALYIDLHQPMFYPNWVMLIFSFFALYGLFAAASSTLDTVRYAEFRARYLKIMGTNNSSQPHD